MLLAIIWPQHTSLVSACVVIIMISSSTKPNSRVTGSAIEIVVARDTDPGFGRIISFTNSIKSFLVTVELQGGLRTNQWLPRVTTQWGSAVLPISDQRVQGVRLLVDNNKLDLLADLHTKADLGEGCVPVRGKFGLLSVKPSLPSVKVEDSFVAPKGVMVVKRLLQ